MGIWNYYFIAKLFLFLGKYIGFHRWENLAFAALLLLPAKQVWMRRLRHALAFATGLALLYYDSWLPPLSRVASQASNLESFSAVYLLELLGRFINVQVLASMAMVLLLVAVLGLRLRLSSFALLGILSAPFLPKIGELAALTTASTQAPAQCAAAVQPPSAVAPSEAIQHFSGGDVNTELQAFYHDEAKRRVIFQSGATPNFDVIVLHICSLAWDDLSYRKDDPALFKRFDVLFKNFNSAASYSGPAAIRLLRGACGQQKHNDLYLEPQSQCRLFQNLADVGFDTDLLLNHDGHFGDFLKDVQQRGGLNLTPLGSLGAAAPQSSFDDTPIYDDYDILHRWWNDLQSHRDAKPKALYYNTISLHDGNRIAGGGAITNSLETFQPRAEKLLNDLDKFITEIESSGRPALVVFVPEHGAAVHGDDMQISGMREIPNPQITLVPVGVKFVGLNRPQASPLTITQPASYLALSELLSRTVRQNPYAQPAPDLSSYVKDLPITDFVSENEDTVIVRNPNGYSMRAPDGSWVDYALPK